MATRGGGRGRSKARASSNSCWFKTRLKTNKLALISASLSPITMTRYSSVTCTRTHYHIACGLEDTVAGILTYDVDKWEKNRLAWL